MNDIKYNNSGYTLLEILIVVFLLGVIAGFVIPNFSKSQNKSKETDAIRQLNVLHSANQLYYSKEGSYWSTDTTSLDAINSALNLSLMANDWTIDYQFTSTSIYVASIITDNFTVQVNQNFLNASNPCCSAGSCPTVPSC